MDEMRILAFDFGTRTGWASSLGDSVAESSQGKRSGEDERDDQGEIEK